MTDPSLLFTFKRVEMFEAADILILERLLRGFRYLMTTPHVLAEASNFVDQAPPHRRLELVEALKRFAEKHQEFYQPANLLVGRAEFSHLGLADTGLSSLSDGAVVVTMDFHLWGRITSQGGQCVNFNHLRSADLLPS